MKTPHYNTGDHREIWIRKDSFTCSLFIENGKVLNYPNLSKLSCVHANLGGEFLKFSLPLC